MTAMVSFEAVLGAVSRFSPDQVTQLVRALEAATSEEAVLAALEGLIGPVRRCPWCQAPEAVKRGRRNGLMRYRCKGCGKTFNALTNSPLARLRMRGKWVLSVQSLMLGDTLKQSAKRCDIHIETAHRWRHRLLGTSARRHKRRTIGGVVEADDTRVRVSHKGIRTLDRKPRKRGGPAELGGKDQVHILVATDREDGVAMQVLEQMNSGGVRYTLSHLLRSGTTLVTDAAKCFSSASRKMGVRHVKDSVRNKRFN
jgi:transposase-like protein